MRLPARAGGLDPELDARLVERCLAGEPRAWEALVTRHEGLVYSVARSWRLSDEDLGDVFQEVFAALVRGLPRLREPRTLVRWLASTTDRIARTTALRRRREQALSDADPQAIERLTSSDEPIGANLERLERQALVRLAMAGLSERCQRLLNALYADPPTPAYAEIAVALGVPIGSLGPTRARCMERLRVLLEPLTDSGISPEGQATFPRAAGSGPRRTRAARAPENKRDTLESTPE